MITRSVALVAVLYVCRGCDTVVYQFTRVGQDSFGLPTPRELMLRISSKCPKCGRELGIPGVNDIVILRKGEARRLLKIGAL